MIGNPLNDLGSDRVLSEALPSGRLAFETAEGPAPDPLLWISDLTPEPGVWGEVQARHGATGLWPLILGASRYAVGGPWTAGELDPSLVVSRPGDHDVAALLAGWWSVYTEVDNDDDLLGPAEQLAITAPFEDLWPGLAAPGVLKEDPAVRAAEFADYLLTDDGRLRAPRLGLSASARGADAPADLGWTGPLNYENDTAQFSAVLRSWEERFGARVVGIGSSEIYLSVAAPPTDAGHALRVAAEHFAFCPDNVWQSSTDSLVRYADAIRSQAWWSFWWD
ncbi:hypothetical protein BJ973_008373 [Actinoplanes tereljensis]|uniref:DUF4253 domain-containing protein n=1 Tax=Paractinoplanes tereljensis TaxID=571912 RepID=A0A919NHQ0_9ACTN|nr:DUF4253 domain-containing protein [Actinoplanes tereljensis]GIF18668.1 hypothetical protein Ate02nite_13980 [Actinoplanes tereljensis]